MDLVHAQAEFAAGRFKEAVAEASQHGKGWRLLLHKDNGETLVLKDESGKDLLYNSLDQAAEVGREIGFESVRVEEHF